MIGFIIGSYYVWIFIKLFDCDYDSKLDFLIELIPFAGFLRAVIKAFNDL